MITPFHILYKPIILMQIELSVYRSPMRVAFSCNRKAERDEEQTGKTSTGRCQKGNQTKQVSNNKTKE